MISKSIIYEGKVQGVGFRYFVLNIALDLKIYGFVKNLPNGNVYAEISGSNIKISDFITKTSDGPPLARVVNIIVNDIPTKHKDIFKIKH